QNQPGRPVPDRFHRPVNRRGYAIAPGRHRTDARSDGRGPPARLTARGRPGGFSSFHFIYRSLQHRFNQKPMSPISSATFTVNGILYAPPARPVVAICLDGSADEYFDAALARGRMPNFQQLSVRGYRGLARGAMPSFTN